MLVATSRRDDLRRCLDEKHIEDTNWCPYFEVVVTDLNKGKVSVGRRGSAKCQHQRYHVEDPLVFAYVCGHCKLFPMEDSLWWVSADHGERRKKNSMSGWWSLRAWRKPTRLFTLQAGDTANEQVVFPAYGAPHGECHESNKNRLAEAWESLRWTMHERQSPWASWRSSRR